MMASHILKKEERDALMFEILRVLRPNGWFFFKTFILEEDKNAQRMLKENPGPEEGMYIHPEIGHAEYVWTVKEIKKQFGDFFTIHKIEKSFKHLHKDGTAWKRRTACVYLEKTS
jgi:ubiquinone/menaquinone biosynthesis C-methylase UbiE